MCSSDLAREAGVKVTIVSSDKDLMQLVGPDVSMRDPMSNRLIGPAEVEDKFGVGPDRVIDVQVGRLRRKLGDDPREPMLIRTVRGDGYLFSPPVIRC